MPYESLVDSWTKGCTVSPPPPLLYSPY